MNKKIYAGVMALILSMSGMFYGCGQSNTEDVKESGHLSSVESDNDSVAEIIPNDASDFKWREFTAEEAPEFQGGILITGYVGERTDVVIPKSIQDKPVVAIGEFAFSPLNADDILKSGDDIPLPDLKLTLLEIVGLIDNQDFDGLEIERIKRSISNEEIASALEQRTPISNIKQVLIPNSISYIGGCSFAFCGNLETVKMYDISEDELPLIQVDAISGSDFESYPFYACNNLKETNFYLNADEVCGTDSCYNYCTSLKKIYLYPNFRYEVRLGNWGVYTLNNLNSIVIKDGCTYIYNDISYKHKTFAGCTFYIPASVTEIDDHIFCTHFNNGEYDTEGSPDVDDCKICDNILIVTPSGSYAESYAKASNIPYRNE